MHLLQLTIPVLAHLGIAGGVLKRFEWFVFVHIVKTVSTQCVHTQFLVFLVEMIPFMNLMVVIVVWRCMGPPIMSRLC